MKRTRSTSRTWTYRALGALVGLFALWLLFVVIVRPSNGRDWNVDQDRLPHAVFSGNRVTIENVRDFSYENTTSYNVSWTERSFDLSQVQSVWFMVERFDAFAGIGHTLLSFALDDGTYLVVSVEIRKEKGESYSPTKGMLRRYELMYVVGTEDDLIQLRTNHRKDDVWLYPINTTPEKAQALLVQMLERANGLAAHPEFYNTVTNTCTTNIVDHVNSLADRVPLSWKVLLPGYSDELAFDLGLIDTDAASIKEAREEFFITEKALTDDGPYSQRIR